MLGKLVPQPENQPEYPLNSPVLSLAPSPGLGDAILTLRHPCLNLKPPQKICLMSLRHPSLNLKQPKKICLMSLRYPCLSLIPPKKSVS